MLKKNTLNATKRINIYGFVAEWFKAHAWKVCWGQPLEGSNPSETAIYKHKSPITGLFLYFSNV